MGEQSELNMSKVEQREQSIGTRLEQRYWYSGLELTPKQNLILIGINDLGEGVICILNYPRQILPNSLYRQQVGIMIKVGRYT